MGFRVLGTLTYAVLLLLRIAIVTLNPTNPKAPLSLFMQ